MNEEPALQPVFLALSFGIRSNENFEFAIRIHRIGIKHYFYALNPEYETIFFYPAGYPEFYSLSE